MARKTALAKNVSYAWASWKARHGSAGTAAIACTRTAWIAGKRVAIPVPFVTLLFQPQKVGADRQHAIAIKLPRYPAVITTPACYMTATEI